VIVPRDLKFEFLKFQEAEDAALALLAKAKTQNSATSEASPTKNFLILFIVKFFPPLKRFFKTKMRL
jgi:hypothetical protein